jgi:hypothetical protein
MGAETHLAIHRLRSVEARKFKSGSRAIVPLEGYRGNGCVEQGYKLSTQTGSHLILSKMLDIVAFREGNLRAEMLACRIFVAC